MLLSQDRVNLVFVCGSLFLVVVLFFSYLGPNSDDQVQMFVVRALVVGAVDSLIPLWLNVAEANRLKNTL